MATYIDEVNEVGVARVNHLAEALVAGRPQLALAIWDDNGSVVVVEEDLAARGPGQNRPRRHAFYLHHQRHVVFLVLAWEQGVPHVELIEDAAETPHVDGGVVGDAEDNFGGAVEARLNVGVDFLVFKAPAPEVDDLDAALVDLAE